METHDLQQGSAAWHAHRAAHFNASDAPAMLGCSPYMTRTQLLHKLHTGLSAEVDPATQRRFDDGHLFEALARPLAEEIIGTDLYPCTGTEGELSASFDGLTMAEDVAFEHKTLSTELREVMEGEDESPRLPKHYRVQMEQQLLVSGAERVLFMASKWDGETLVEERHCWYSSDPALRAEIIAGWKQFAIDLAAYVPPAAADPAPIGRAPETLPALHIEVTGMVTASNLAAFKEHALAVFGGINRNLATDADFANAEKTVKWCGDVEDRLKAAKQHALSQTASIDALFSAIDDISAEARTVRLELDKLVKARKEAIRGEIVAEGIAALRQHVAGLNARLEHPYMPPTAADFAGAIRNKRTVDSLRDAVHTTLANAKIESSAIADRIDANLKTMHRLAGGYTGMFPDASTLVLKAPDDFEAAVQFRVAERERREKERLDAEREQIRAEEQAKAEKDAREKMEREQAEAAEKKRKDEWLEGAEAREQARQAEIAGAVLQVRANAADPIGEQLAALPVLGKLISKGAPGSGEFTFEPAANVVPLGTRAPAVDPAATIRLGQIGERLGFALTADFLAQLGFHPVSTEKNAKLYRLSDFDLLCEALIAHVRTAQHQLQAA